MKNSKLFISTLFAAAALGISADAAYLDLYLGTATHNETADATYDYIRVTNGTINISNNAVITTGSFRGTSGNANGPTTLNIQSGATLTVTGTGTSVSAGSASFMLANWSRNGTVNVAGTLNVNSGLSSRDGNGFFNVNNGGVVNFVNGLTFAARNRSNSMNFALNNGGRINIGSGGIEATATDEEQHTTSTPNFTIDGGTIGILGTDASAAWSTSRELEIGANGLTVDTMVYKMASDGNSSAAIDPAVGGTITLTGAISGGNALTKDGAGTLALTAAATLGATTVNAGTLSFAGTTSLGTTTVASGAALD
ncbi:MAG: autotransporter-associated beta strand repeat-containing protein, partial [Opitutales bacterium]|nr:autotransporter-associated beta strand repeat-containing protein [Opitutales bacterium]